MIREFNNEPQAKAIAESLGLIITKYRGVYIVSNSKEELLTNYGLGYHQKKDIFYDKESFREDKDGFLVIKNKNIVDASSIEIPHNLKNCSFLFMDCISLKIPPIIPESVKDCYSMFWGCSSLEIPPKIPEGVKDCAHMFYGCTSLKEPPRFPENSNTTSALWNTPFEKS